MSYDVPQVPGEQVEDSTGDHEDHGWPLWEVFVRPRRGLNHTHAGSLHAPDAETAVQNARDAYTRRAEGISVWVVQSTAVHASDDSEAMFEPFEDRPYTHPTFYDIPDEVGQM